MKKLAIGKLAVVLGMAALCGIISSCGKSYDGAASTSQAAPAMNSSGGAAMSMKTAAIGFATESIDEEAFEMDEPEPNPSSKEGTSTIERKLIRTGRIDTEVESLADTREMLNGWIKKYNGYISDSSKNGKTLHATARIPSRYFDQAMNDALGFGKLRSKNVSSEDVTDQYYDIATRLDTKKVMLERLEAYLKEAKDVKDMIELESKINDVTSEIESMQGRLNRLAALVDYSTINISATLPPMQTERGFTLPDTKNAFWDFISNTLSFFVGLFFVVLYVIIFGIPIVLVLSLLYWICFGKIGILRRLFKKISFKKN